MRLPRKNLPSGWSLSVTTTSVSSPSADKKYQNPKLWCSPQYCILPSAQRASSNSLILSNLLTSERSGRSGIRTHGDVTATLDFESSALNQAQPSFLEIVWQTLEHSAISSSESFHQSGFAGLKSKIALTPAWSEAPSGSSPM